MRLCTASPCATKRGRADTDVFDQQNETSGESRRFCCHTELQLKSLEKILRQHRTIASASLSRLFAPLPQFRKWEIHTVFLHFWNFELEQKSCLRLLAELCGAALIARRARSSYETCFVISFLIIQRTGMTIHIESTKTNTGTRKIPMTEDVYRCF